MVVRCAVLHGGIYYKTGSLKAQMCVEGRRMLYDYAKERSVPHKAIGKLIVAQNDAQMAKVKELLQQAHTNEVRECRLVAAEECKEIEPAVAAIGGLYCPVTGIIDSEALMAALLQDAQHVRSAPA